MQASTNRPNHQIICYHHCAAAGVLLAVLLWSGFGFCGEIHAAAKRGDLATVKALITRNTALANSLDKDRDTPLHVASLKGHTDVVKMLLDRGAKANAKDRWGLTALHVAARGGYQDIAELLLSHGADVNAQDQDAYTPLHEAASGDHKDVAKLLLTHGAEVNAGNRYGETPLFMATARGYRDMAELLLGHGAKLNATIHNRTALHRSGADGQEELAELLWQQGSHEWNSNTSCGLLPSNALKEL
jgi:ankyrin repeat protein